MNFDGKKIFVAGSGGMVGGSIVRALNSKNIHSVIGKSSSQLNLIDQRAVNEFFDSERPEIVIMAAARVGGILANNKYRADFIYQNLMIEANIIDAAHRSGVEKLIFLGSSCIYPRLANQPMVEEDLLTGQLESTNEPYAIAKIAGIKLCESYFRQYGSNFFSVMPTNLYGPNDNFDLETSHVIPALIRKFHDAKCNGPDSVVIWGTGRPRREFLFVDDLSEAVVFALENLNAADIYNLGISHFNIGSGTDVEISEVASIIKKIVGYTGNFVFDETKPDGTPRKLLDVRRLKQLGWSYKTPLERGLELTYEWYKNR